MMHVVSIILLIVRLMATKNAVGISIKTQELYLVVFVCRYLDLFTSFYSMYNSVMKVMYISSTAYVIFMVYKTEPFKTEYDRTQDSFLHWQFAVAPCAVLALITVLIQGFDFMEVCGCGCGCEEGERECARSLVICPFLLPHFSLASILSRALLFLSPVCFLLFSPNCVNPVI